MSETAVDFYCLGGLHFDLKCFAQAKPCLGESIPAHTHRCFGGVAHNVAANLLKLKAKVALCSIVGNDPPGQELLQTLGAAGMDVQDIICSTHSPTATYIALLQKNGELFVAAADMAIYDELTKEKILPLIRKRFQVPHWLIDANLPAESIEAVAQCVQGEGKLWGIGSSAAKAMRLAAGFPHWHGLFLNRRELLALSNKKHIPDGIEVLVEQGCSLVVVTAGVDGIFYWHGGGIYHEPLEHIDVVDVTGGGDAFCAGFLVKIVNGSPLPLAIRYGLSTAKAAVLSLNSSIDGSK